MGGGDQGWGQLGVRDGMWRETEAGEGTVGVIAARKPS